ncbi:MAG: GtrA family protein [Bacteroidaceae bacterium]|nr:GtrA family protein [Bacteroidaceae bacterium]
MKKNFLIDKTFGKFIIVGIINTVVGTGIMFAFYNLLHFDYWISSAANYFFGSILSFFLNKYFTFQYHERSWKVILKFTVNILVCYFLAYGLAKPFALFILSSQPKVIQENVAMAFGMCFFVILNYAGQRFWAFKKNDSKEDTHN